MLALVSIALAGGMGALCRYGVSLWARRALGEAFPYGTLIVNVVGCLLLGLLLEYCRSSTSLPETWRLALGVGFLGALTTFSTFGVESVRLLQSGAYGAALASVGANLVLGFSAVGLGLVLGRVIS